MSLFSRLRIPVLFCLLVVIGTSSAAGQTGTNGAQSFGNVNVGQSTTQTVTVVSGNSATQLTTIFGKDFKASATTCTPNGGGAFLTYNCSATVTFAPTAVGQRFDSIFYPNGDGVPTPQLFLYGTGIAPQIGFTFGSFATGTAPSVANPGGITVGPDGLVYLSSTSAKDVFSSNPDGTNQQPLGFSGLSSPGAVVVDGETNVYVADTVNNKVYKKNDFGPPGIVSTTALSDPIGLAVDGTGALYIADAGNSRIIKIDNQGNETTVASELNSLVGIAFDAAGDLFYAQGGSINAVHYFAGGDPSNVVTVGSSAYGTIQAISVDAGGGVDLATNAGLVVFSSYQQLLGTGFDGPTSVAVDPQGNIYEAFKPSTTNAVAIVTRNTGALTVGIPPGQTTAGTIYIANTGTAALTFSSFTFSDPAFTVNESSSCAGGNIVQVGQTCTLAVNFSPTTLKTYTATLTVGSNSLNGTATNQYTLTGNTPQSATTLSVSPATATTGQLVTFTAPVLANYYNGTNVTDVTPTGTVNFVSGQTTLGSATLSAAPNGGQQAIFTTSSLAPGTYSVTAVYPGTDTIAGSSSTPVTVTVSSPANLAPTMTALAVSSNAIQPGQTETLVAQISGATSQTLSGTVSFFSGTTLLGTVGITPTFSGGSAQYFTSSLPVGTLSITATYSGDTNYATSTSAPQIVTVTAAPLNTTTTLTLPSTVAYKTPVALTAAVADSNGLPVTVGQVFFCDTTVTICNSVINLGVAQLTSAGTAVLRLAPGTIATHSYKAVFLGRTDYITSTSTAQTIAVTGIYASTSAITSTGSAGNYSLTGTVTGLGTRVLGPTGTISFNDTTNANAVLGTAALGAATLGFTAVQPTGSPYTVGTSPYGIASGDFNGDGFADIVTGNYNAASVSVLLGNGDGTFKAAVSYAAGGDPERVLVADFNGDGKPDIVVANTASGTVSVLLGNGDGTFQAQTTYSTGSPVGLGVMDLNHDGFPDIVAGNYYAGNVSVLLNNGDGTFAAAVNYTTGGTPQTLVEGDFNGDGNVDLAVGNEAGTTIGILLGNGDGTFQAQVNYAVGRLPQGIQVGDFNGDGKEDLAVLNNGDNNISILFGNGDGTFQTQVTYPVGSDPVGLVIADFNGDGIQDLSTGNTDQADLTQSILLGNGDGTFQPQMKFPAGNFPYGEVAADFNGDGLPDLAISDFNYSTATILLSEVTQTATATITGVAVGGASGTHNVGVSYPGDTNFAASVSATTPLMVGGAVTVASATRLTIAPLAASAGQNVSFAVCVAGATQSAPVPTGMVTLSSTNSSLGSTSLTLDATGSATFSTNQIPVGTYAVTATYSGDTNYAASTSTPQTLVVSLATQTITFAAIPNHAVNDAPFALAATASSGLAVTYNVVSGPATLSGSTVTLTGAAGTVVIRASQAGNTSYAAATSVTQSFTVSLATQTITFPAIPSHTIEDAPITLSATASSGLAVTYTLVSGPATLSGNIVTLAGTTGTVVIQASQSGNTTYAAATSVTQSFTVSGALVPTLTAITPSAIVTGSAATTITLTGTNFNSVDVLRLNGATTIATTFVNATTLTAIVPASALVTAGTIQVAVNDLIGKTTSNSLSITVSNTPAVVFSGPTTPPASGQQPTLTFQLTNPYPVALTASFNLLFTPSTTPAVDDPAIQFADGGRNLTFTIAANSVVTPAIQLQAGTEAGTITVPVTLTAQGVDVTPANLTPVVIVIPPAAPVVNLVTMNTSGGGVNVVVTGYSNTREATQAKFHFTAASGADLNTPDFTATITPLFTTWYGSAASAPYGSTVVYTQSFTLDSGTASNITGVTVTLTNSVGTSNTGSSQ